MSVKLATAESIPLADGSIDVAWAINTFHHWQDRDVGMAEVRRVVKPGGRFLVVEQHRNGRTGSALSEESAAKMVSEIEAGGFTDGAVSTFSASDETHTLIQVTRA